MSAVSKVESHGTGLGLGALEEHGTQFKRLVGALNPHSSSLRVCGKPVGQS